MNKLFKILLKSSKGRGTTKPNLTHDITDFIFKNLLFDGIICLPKTVFLIEDLLDLHVADCLGKKPSLEIFSNDSDSFPRISQPIELNMTFVKNFEENFVYLSTSTKKNISISELPETILDSLKSFICQTLPHYNWCGKEFKSEREAVFIGHVGLGDHIIQVGLVKFLATKYKKVYISSANGHEKHLKYVYKNAPNVEVIDAGCWTSFKEIDSLIQNVPVEKLIGADQKYGIKDAVLIECGCSRLNYQFAFFDWNFNSNFYLNNNIPYEVSFDYFNLPESPKDEEELFNHLMNIYNISGDYIVVSNEFSHGSFDLNVKTNLPIVYLKKDEDIKKNIFMSRKVLIEAKELHLINSAMVHLAERLPLKGQIVFHHKREKDFCFRYPEKVKIIH
jgi:hypothetical protein